MQLVCGVTSPGVTHKLPMTRLCGRTVTSFVPGAAQRHGSGRPRAETADTVQEIYFYCTCHSTKSPRFSRVTFQTLAQVNQVFV